MKSSLLIACLILSCSVNSMNAQTKIKRKMINPTGVKLTSSSSELINGALYQVNDSSIMISSFTKPKMYALGNVPRSISEIYVIDIKIIDVVRRTRVRNARLIGAGVGLTTGVLMSKYVYPWREPLETTVATTVLTGIGAIIGGGIGSIRIRIPIKGSMDNFNRKKAKLTKYSINK